MTLCTECEDTVTMGFLLSLRWQWRHLKYHLDLSKYLCCLGWLSAGADTDAASWLRGSPGTASARPCCSESSRSPLWLGVSGPRCTAPSQLPRLDLHGRQEVKWQQGQTRTSLPSALLRDGGDSAG